MRVKLRTVPACRCVVAEMRQLKWDWERDEPGRGSLSNYTSYTRLRAELRGGSVWAVGHRVSGGGGAAEESEPVEQKIGPWPKIAAAGWEA